MAETIVDNSMTPRSPKRLRFGDFTNWQPWAGFVGLYLLSSFACLFWGNFAAFSPAFIVAIPILITLSVVDYQSNRIPDYCSLTLGAIAIGVAYQDQALILHVCTATIFGILLWCISEWYFRIHTQEALGLGDIKLIVAMTIWLGPEYVAIMLFLASVTGIIVVLLERFRNVLRAKTHTQPEQDQLEVPFGPFLAYSFFLTIVTSAA